MQQPQLIVQDFGGHHSGNMEKTRARLMKGGSWKKQRVIVVLPADSMIPAKVALSHWNLIFPPNNGVIRILAQGMEVGHAYSTALEQILGNPELAQWEYLLTMEHDNLPPQDGLLNLLETLENNSHLSAVSGLYFTKGEGGVAQIWGDPNDPVVNFRPQIPKPNCVQECVGIGMGFAVYRISMFKDPRIKRPFFETKKGLSGCSTQDLAFWGEARKYGHRCAVDTRVKVGHYDVKADMVW